MDEDNNLWLLVSKQKDKFVRDRYTLGVLCGKILNTEMLSKLGAAMEPTNYL